MTRPSPPPTSPAGEVVEMDAMDGLEWEQGQRTPQTSDANLAALVRKSATAPELVAPDGPRKAPLVVRARVPGPGSPQPRGAGSVAMSAQPAARPTPPVQELEHAAASAGRPPTPVPAAVARAGSPALNRAPSSLALEEAASPGEPPTLNDVLHRAPPRVAPRAGSDSTPTLNDILQRAVRRPLPSAPDRDGAPIVMPLQAPAESVRNPVPLASRDVPAPPPHERAPEAATGESGRLEASSRRLLLVIGGIAGCAALAAAVFVMTGNRSGDSAAPAQADPPQGSATPAPDPVGASPASPPKPATATARAHDAVTMPVAPPGKPLLATPPPLAAPEPPARRVPLALADERPATVAPIHPGRRLAKKLGSKKLVVDYSARTSEAKAPGLVAQTTEDPAIGLARAAYLSGNQKLFDGDAEGAIHAYREALDLYPGYVGGYRGLGLAYAQLGDSPQALEAFTTYVSAVPSARDVALIKKRIARLRGK